MILFGHLVGKVVCEKLNCVAPRRKKHGKHENACNMKKGRKSCRLFISFCKMKLFVRKKMLYAGFEPRTPPSQFLRSNGTAIATEIHCGLSISYILLFGVGHDFT